MQRFFLVGLVVVIGVFIYYFIFQANGTGVAVNSVPLTSEESKSPSLAKQSPNETDNVTTKEINPIDEASLPADHDAEISSRQINIADEVILPLPGSAPTENVKHNIPIEEIRQGCFRQDCIPSVDDPVFTSSSEVDKLIDDQSIGLALSYKGVNRFYSFNMLVTREIVNDVVAGDPLLVTYCPLCGTGIVFERRVNAEVQEFGVSGMLWQSNLLMYNRADDLADRNLWSQALGEAVVGNDTGSKLTIVPSDIMRYGDWKKANPGGEVLNTGSANDPYNGNYYGVAMNFAPDFDEANSPLDPTEYVYGIEVAGTFKAYAGKDLPSGVTTDVVNGVPLTIINDSDTVLFKDEAGEIIPDTEGFWFSWVAVHPKTLLWDN